MAGNLTRRCDLLHIAQVDKMGRQEAGYEGSEFSKWTTFTSVLASGENNSCWPYIFTAGPLLDTGHHGRHPDCIKLCLCVTWRDKC